MLAITGELGRLEEIFGDAVYPVWPLWAAAGVFVGIAFVYLAFRQRWHRVAVRHPLLSGLAAVVIRGLSVPTGYYLFSPLFERSLACEASPVAGAGAGSEKCADAVSAAGETPAP